MPLGRCEGKGTRKKVSRETKVNFDSKIKEELFALLSADVASCNYQSNKGIYIMYKRKPRFCKNL